MYLDRDCARIIMEYTDDRTNRLVSSNWNHVVHPWDKFIVEKCLKRNLFGRLSVNISDGITANEINKLRHGSKILRHIKLWEITPLEQINVNVMKTWLTDNNIIVTYDEIYDKYTAEHDDRHTEIIRRTIPGYDIVNARMTSTTPYTMLLLLVALTCMILGLSIALIVIAITCTTPIVKKKELLGMGSIFGWLFFHTTMCLCGITFIVIRNMCKRTYHYV